MKKFIFSMICTLLPILASAQVQNEELTPYAVLSENNTILTFFYDNDKESQGGMDIGPFTSADERGWNEHCESIGHVIFDGSFADCSAITSTRYWFKDFSNLTIIDGLENLNTENVTDMAYMFAGCSSLTSLDLSNFNTSNVTEMQSTFSQCSGLETIYVGNGWSTENIESGGDMFTGCTVLVGGEGTTYEANHVDYTYAHIDKATDPGYLAEKLDYNEGDFFTTETVEGVTMSFRVDDATQRICRVMAPEEDQRAIDTATTGTVTIPAKAHGYTVNRINDYAFQDCSGVTEFVIPNSVESIEQCAFKRCTSLTTVHIPASVTTIDGLNGKPWVGCTSLTTITVDEENPNFDSRDNCNAIMETADDILYMGCKGTKIPETTKVIGHSSFDSMGELPALEIPASVTSIVAYAFWECSFPSVTSYIEEPFKTSSVWDHLPANCPLYVPQGKVEAYKAVSEWSNFTTIIEIGTEAYAALNEDNSVLTFYYDDQKAARGGMGVGPFTLNLSNKTVNSGWDEVRENIQQVVFNESFANCTTITSTSCWFYGFTNLTSIKDLENLKTDNVTDMSCMFWGCSSLTSLDVSNFNTSNVTDMNYMFAACESLASLELGDNFNTSNVTDMTSMFGACESLTSIDVSNFNTANVTNMGSMFSGCSGLTSLDVTGFDTSKAIYMSSMFWGCSSLTSLDVTGFDTSNATDLSGMFNGCSGLTSLDVSGFDTSKATTMEIMFGSCESLTSLDLSNFNTSNVTRMWKMFSGCSNLTNLNVSGLNTSNVTVMTAMFEDCSSLTNLDLSSFNTSNVTTMYQMFYHCSGLETIYVGNEWSTESIESGDNMFTGCTALVGGAGTTYDENNVDYTYAHIDGGTSSPGYLSGAGQAVPYAALSDNNAVLTFYYDDQKAIRGGMSVGPFTETSQSGWWILGDNIESVVFDESFANCTTITSTSYWFCGLFNLKTITGLENLKTDNVTDMSHMFESCQKLTILDVSGFNTSNVTNMSSMFYDCESLTTIYAGEGWNTENISSIDAGADMFFLCTAIVGDAGTIFDENHVDYTYARIDEGAPEPGYFSDSPTLDKPYAVLSENNRVLTFYYDDQKATRGGWGVGPFNEASKKSWDNQSYFIESVVFDESFANCTKINSTSYWFDHFKSLTTITGLENLKTDNVTDMSSMFSQCYSLTSLNISGFNTSNVKNMSRMFYDCESLTTIYAGEGWSTENILSEDAGAEMFTECTALVGSAGTTYDTNHVDYTYAQIDEGTSDPGYFTDKVPYAVLNEVNGALTLTFFYDNKRDERGGMSVGPFAESYQRGWDNQSTKIEQVLFDDSFANYLPTSTRYWFYNFSKLTDIPTLNKMKTNNVTDMSYMFTNCSSLTSLDVSGFDTSKATNMTLMFYNCESLTSLDITGFDTSNVTDMGSMFEGCSSLTSLDVSGFDTSKATNMTLMFYNCESLTSLDITGFDTSKATYMGHMFEDCSSLTNLDVSGFDTSNATDLGGMFNGCSGLISLDVSGFDTSNATDLSSMFNGCSGLTSLDVSGFDTSNAKYMSNMFGYCSSLTNLNLSNFNTLNVTYMNSMFSHCSGLETIYVGDGWSIGSISSQQHGVDMFTECTVLVGGAGTTYDPDHVNVDYAHIDGGSSNPGYLSGTGQAVPYAVLNEDNSVLTFYYDDQKAARGGMDVGPFDDGGKKNGCGWSEVNEEITTVVFDDSFANCTTLTSTAYWFYGCENLTTIKNFSNLKTDNVIDINSMFHDCHSLKSIDFSSLNLSKVTNMHQVFEDCRTLESVNFSGVNTENVTDMSDLFLNCHNLKTIDISSFNTKNVTNMKSMFLRCDVLTTIYVGEEWTTENVTESESMFRESPNLVGGRGTTYDENHIGIEYAHIDGGTSNPGYLTDINAASEETWTKLQSRIEYGTDVLSRAKEISSVDQALIEKLDEALQSANQMYNIHTASEDEVLHMIEVLNERIQEVEEAMNQPASEETWEELKATIEYGTDVLAKAKEISTIDQWLIEELDMTLDSGNQMYKIHEASEEEVLNMIDELNWRIKEVEEAMNQPASDEAWAELNKAVETGEKLQTEAKGVSTVEPWALEELENMTAKGSEMYKVHTAGEEEVRHMTEELNQIINEVEEMMRQQPQPQPQGEALFDGLTAWVSGSYTLDDAFEDIGGRSEAAKTIAAIVWNADNALTADMLSGIDNPNLLVFVTEASKAPSGVQNVVIDGVAAEIVLTDATGNNNFYCPQSFTAKSISYSRDFSQTTEIDVCRGWETIALPFDVQSITHESHGTLVPFGGSDNGYPFWLRQLSTNGLARATKIEANRPYLICMPNNIIYPPEYNQNGTVTFSSSNVTVPVTSARSVSGAGVTFHATFQQVTKNSSVYALNVGETRGEYPEGSVFEQNYRDIRPFQAYTTHSAGTRSFITLESLGGNDDATGIEELRIKNSEFGDAEGVWYSLDGRRLDAKPTKKGVYVKDGRKIVIK